MTKRALITGISGQDGSYLAEHLLSMGYEVHGLVRRVSLEAPESRLGRIEHLLDSITLHPASLESYPDISQVMSRHDFDECYHLAARSFVAESFADGFTTLNTNIIGTHFVLAALRESQPKCRFFFAGSSEMFGKPKEVPQNESTAFYPRNSYGVSKLAGFHLTRNCREVNDLYCVNGILFNHESPRRGVEFVSRKITNAVARIKLGLASELRIGNLEAQRDWGHAADYVRAMHVMLQQPHPDDYVIATGQTHSVKDFCELAFAEVNLDYHDYVKVDERYYRPSEVDLLVGDATKARTELGWQPTRTFPELIHEMVQEELKALGQTTPNQSSVLSTMAI